MRKSLFSTEGTLRAFKRSAFQAGLLIRRCDVFRSWVKGWSTVVGGPSVVAIVGLMLVAAWLGGCSTTHYRKSADREAYALIEEKTPDVDGMVSDVNIDYEEPPPLDGLPVNDATLEDLSFLGDEAQTEVGAHVLTLEKALDIAFNHSREYQNQKEGLYLQALSLTLDRYNYAPIFSGTMSQQYERFTRDVTNTNELGAVLGSFPSAPGVPNALAGTTNFAADIETLTGTPAALLNDYAAVVAAAATVLGANTTELDVVDERRASGDVRLGVNLLLKGGGRLAATLTSNFLRFVTGDPREVANSVLTGSFSQPLLRGRGREVAAERLTQAERDLLYRLRTFTRFRKTFSVRVASQYYGVLRNRDQVSNNFAGLEGFRLAFERTKAMADEGEISLADVGRQEQAVLSRESSWINSIQRYQQNLDIFKILLGLSTDASLVLDVAELDALAERGLIHFDLPASDAVEVALATRLDLFNERDRLDDTKRWVRVAANALQPGLDLVLTGTLNSKSGNRPLSPDFRRAQFSAALDTDLPLDRKRERNDYRRSLITLERQMRDLELAEDNVKLDVRDAWRTLEQAKLNYEISDREVEVNRLRVEEQDLRAELGLGDVLDQVDALNNLVDSENALTSQLVAHTIARLTFWQDMGILFIKENGQWKEISNVEDS